MTHKREIEMDKLYSVSALVNSVEYQLRKAFCAREMSFQTFLRLQGHARKAQQAVHDMWPP